MNKQNFRRKQVPAGSVDGPNTRADYKPTMVKKVNISVVGKLSSPPVEVHSIDEIDNQNNNNNNLNENTEIKITNPSNRFERYEKNHPVPAMEMKHLDTDLEEVEKLEDEIKVGSYNAYEEAIIMLADAALKKTARYAPNTMPNQLKSVLKVLKNEANINNLLLENIKEKSEVNIPRLATLVGYQGKDKETYAKFYMIKLRDTMIAGGFEEIASRLIFDVSNTGSDNTRVKLIAPAMQGVLEAMFNQREARAPDKKLQQVGEIPVIACSTLKAYPPIRITKQGVLYNEQPKTPFYLQQDTLAYYDDFLPQIIDDLPMNSIDNTIFKASFIDIMKSTYRGVVGLTPQQLRLEEVRKVFVKNEMNRKPEHYEFLKQSAMEYFQVNYNTTLDVAKMCGPGIASAMLANYQSMFGHLPPVNGDAALGFPFGYTIKVKQAYQRMIEVACEVYDQFNAGIKDTYYGDVSEMTYLKGKDEVYDLPANVDNFLPTHNIMVSAGRDFIGTVLGKKLTKTRTIVVVSKAISYVVNAVRDVMGRQYKDLFESQQLMPIRDTKFSVIRKNLLLGEPENELRARITTLMGEYDKLFGKQFTQSLVNKVTLVDNGIERTYTGRQYLEKHLGFKYSTRFFNKYDELYNLYINEGRDVTSVPNPLNYLPYFAADCQDEVSIKMLKPDTQTMIDFFQYDPRLKNLEWYTTRIMNPVFPLYKLSMVRGSFNELMARILCVGKYANLAVTSMLSYYSDNIYMAGTMVSDLDIGDAVCYDHMGNLRTSKIKNGERIFLSIDGAKMESSTNRKTAHIKLAAECEYFKTGEIYTNFVLNKYIKSVAGSRGVLLDKYINMPWLSSGCPHTFIMNDIDNYANCDKYVRAKSSYFVDGGDYIDPDLLIHLAKESGVTLLIERIVVLPPRGQDFPLGVEIPMDLLGFSAMLHPLIYKEDETYCYLPVLETRRFHKALMYMKQMPKHGDVEQKAEKVSKYMSLFIMGGWSSKAKTQVLNQAYVKARKGILEHTESLNFNSDIFDLELDLKGFLLNNETLTVESIAKIFMDTDDKVTDIQNEPVNITELMEFNPSYILSKIPIEKIVGKASKDITKFLLLKLIQNTHYLSAIVSLDDKYNIVVDVNNLKILAEDMGLTTDRENLDRLGRAIRWIAENTRGLNTNYVDIAKQISDKVEEGRLFQIRSILPYIKSVTAIESLLLTFSADNKAIDIINSRKQQILKDLALGRNLDKYSTDDLKIIRAERKAAMQPLKELKQKMTAEKEAKRLALKQEIDAVSIKMVSLKDLANTKPEPVLFAGLLKKISDDDESNIEPPITSNKCITRLVHLYGQELENKLFAALTYMAGKPVDSLLLFIDKVSPNFIHYYIDTSRLSQFELKPDNFKTLCSHFYQNMGGPVDHYIILGNLLRDMILSLTTLNQLGLVYVDPKTGRRQKYALSSWEAEYIYFLESLIR